MPEVFDGDDDPGLSIMLAGRNEEGAIGQLIEQIRIAMQRRSGRQGIPVVDGASTNGTAERAETSGVRVIRHRNADVIPAVTAV